MTVETKRAYEEPSKSDGYRVLVDRMWPRGVAKDELKADEWLKDVAPSDELRKDFHAGDLSWDEFRRAYLMELKEHRETLRPLAKRADSSTVTLLFSSKDEEHNNAVVLRQYLQMLD
ncbi:Uncharacterized conserved protein YeaO, DUF488 family [Marinobacter daqiaonensis]|uniref:Uncharacterized conserved protein YeaO, DUF488 family n=1 Tax=Marinobacter daqiaonensis TaxID=650891 RepID=A0A1I6HG21_9GAMM|nr:DUF488 family protein [Marinobacter daqiaonensis]SFR53456.1 Uncharacterized conserved protein YeaO, DUF488 family [Marinobacter daqiaonensis]